MAFVMLFPTAAPAFADPEDAGGESGGADSGYIDSRDPEDDEVGDVIDGNDDGGTQDEEDGDTRSTDDVYFVILDPGEGMGEPVTYRSDEGEIAENMDCGVQNGQFYHVGDDGMGFRFDNETCPDGWTAPTGYAFDGFDGAGELNTLSSLNTTFTAKWRQIPQGETVLPLIEPEAAPTSAQGSINVYFTDALNWGDVYIHYWGSESTEWPGTAMTLYEASNDFGQPVYQAAIPAGVTGIIFNGNGLQTVDITESIAADAQWYTTGETDDQGHYRVATASFNGCYYVVGTMTNWVINADYQLAQPTSGLYSMNALELTASDQFKIVYSADNSTVTTWYPADGDNYAVTQDGAYDVEFRPVGNQDGWFYGCFQVIRRPVLTLQANNGDTAAYSKDAYVAGAQAEIPTCDFTHPQGLEFVVWCTEAVPTGSGEYYVPGDTITLNEDLTLYAQWAEEEPIASCGDVLTWSFANSTLTIRGTGAMYEYTTDTQPWASVRDQIVQIDLPDGITSIGRNAFADCTGLTSVDIPDSVTSIGYWAFAGCSSLASVSLGSGVSEVVSGAFLRCSALTAFQVEEGNLTFAAPDGVLYNTIQNKLVAYPGGKQQTSYVIADGTTQIDLWAFTACTALTSVTIPEGVTAIGDYACSNCSGLTSITIPDSVASISMSAFADCTGLTSVTVPLSCSVNQYAFYNCTGIEEIHFTPGTGSGSSVLRNLWSYSEAEQLTASFAEGITQIIDGLYGCGKLTALVLPASLTSVGTGAFTGCNNLTDVYYAGTKAQKETIDIAPENIYMGNNDSLQMAVWHCADGDVEPDLVTVTLLANNGGSTELQERSYTYPAGKSLSVWSGSFTYEGYAFTGWNTEADGSGTPYAAGETVTLNDDLTLYAQWAAVVNDAEIVVSATETEDGVQTTATVSAEDLEMAHTLTVLADNAETAVTFDGDAVDSIAANAGESEVILTLITREMQDETLLVTVTLTDSENNELFARGTPGTALITVPFGVEEGKVPLVDLVTDEVRTPVAVVSYTDTAVTFRVEHFSEYEVSQTAVISVVLDRDELTLVVNEQATLTASVDPAAVNVQWTSLNPAVATIADGVVTAVGTGSTTITAAAGDKSASCTVTVLGLIPIEAAYFPDEVFSTWLRESVYAVESEGQYYVDPTAVTEIDCSDKGIASLQGIEFFPALTVLDCSDNQLTALDVSHNPALTELDCSYNMLTEMSIPTAVLTQLILWNNRLETLYVGDPSALIYLDLDNNRLTSLDLRQFTSLETLYCSGNDLRLLYLPAAETAGLSDCYISASSVLGQLSGDADRGYWFDMTTLGIPAAEMSRVNVETGALEGNIVRFAEKPGVLRYTFDTGRVEGTTPIRLTVRVFFGENVPINETTFPDAGFRAYVQSEIADGANVLTAEQIARTTYMEPYVEGTEIRDLTGIQYFVPLQELVLGDTSVTELDLNRNTELTYVDLWYNKLVSLDLRNNTRLRMLYINEPDLMELFLPAGSSENVDFTIRSQSHVGHAVQEGEAYLLDLTAYGLQVENVGRVSMSEGTLGADGIVRFTQLPKRVTYTFDTGRSKPENAGNYLFTVSFLFGEDVLVNETTFPDENFRTFIKEKITDGADVLTMEMIARTTNMNCPGLEIRDLTGIGYFSELSYLNCYNNLLTDLDLSQNTALEQLECGDNRLTQLDVSACQKLMTLYCNNNALTRLDVSQNTSLYNLYCSYNIGLTELALGPVLNYLDCRETGISFIDVARVRSGEIELTAFMAQQEGTGFAVDLSQLIPESRKNDVQIRNNDNTVWNADARKIVYDALPGYAYFVVVTTVEYENGHTETLELSFTIPLEAMITDVTGITGSTFNFTDTGWRCYALSGGTYRLTADQVVAVIGQTEDQRFTISLEADPDSNAKLQQVIDACGEDLATVEVVGASVQAEITYTGSNRPNVRMQNGVLTWNGNIGELDLSVDYGYGDVDNSAAVLTVNGNVSRIDWSDPTTSNGYRGDLFVSGRIEDGYAYTWSTFELNNPHVSTIQIWDHAPIRKTDTSAQPVPIIQDGAYVYGELNWAGLDPDSVEAIYVITATACTVRIITNTDTYSERLEGAFDVSEIPEGASVRIYDSLPNDEPIVLAGQYRTVEVYHGKVEFTGSAESLIAWNGTVQNDRNHSCIDLTVGGTVGTLCIYNAAIDTNITALNTAAVTKGRWYIDFNDIRARVFAVTGAGDVMRNGEFLLPSRQEYEDSPYLVILPTGAALTEAAGFSAENRGAVLDVWDEGRNAVDADMKACLRANEALKDCGIATVFTMRAYGYIIDGDSNNRWVADWSELTLTAPVPVTFLAGADYCIARMAQTEEGWQILDVWSAEEGADRVTTQVTETKDQYFVLLKKLDVTQAVELNTENFPDANFLAWLQNESGYAVQIDGRYYADTELVTTIDCGYRNIRDLTGIALFPELTVLNCYDDLLTTLDVSQNTKLQQLNCGMWNLTELTLGSLPELTSLSCCYTQLTALDVSGCPKLTDLYCYSNRLTTLDVSHNPLLQMLDCNDNRLTTLDVSHNPVLKEMYCQSNQLTELNVGGTALQYLRCRNNRLSSLDLRGIRSLLYVDCQNDPLKQLFLPGTENTGLYAVHYNESTSGASLTQDGQGGYLLDLRTLGIVAEDLSRVTVLSPAVTVTDGVVHFAEKADGMVYIFDTGRLNQETGSNYLLTVNLILGEDVAIDETNFRDPNFRNHVKTEIAGGRDVLTVAEIAETTCIDCYNREIEDLTGIQLFTELKELNCYDNQLTSLDLSGNTKLTQLNCNNNRLTALDVSACTDLQSLYCGSNYALAELVLNESLQCLYCWESDLTMLDLNALPNLKNGEIRLRRFEMQQEEAVYTVDLSGLIPAARKNDIVMQDSGLFDLETMKITYAEKTSNARFSIHTEEEDEWGNHYSDDLYITLELELVVEDVTGITCSSFWFTNSGWRIWYNDAYLRLTADQVIAVIGQTTDMDFYLTLEADPGENAKLQQIVNACGDGLRGVDVRSASVDTELTYTGSGSVNLQVETGSLTWRGDLDQLQLYTDGGNYDNSGSVVTVYGDIDWLDWRDLTIESGYWGDLYVTGRINGGHAYANRTIPLNDPNVSSFESWDKAYIKKNTASAEPVEIILDGEYVFGTLTWQGIDPDDLSIWYCRDTDNWYIIIERYNYGSYGRSLPEDFQTSDIPIGAKVWVNDSLPNNETLVLAGEYDAVKIYHGKVELTGSAETLTVYNQNLSTYYNHPNVDLGIAGTVGTLRISRLAIDTNITVRDGGSVAEGVWEPNINGVRSRVFEVTGAGDIMRNGDFLLPNRQKENSDCMVILPGSAALAEALGYTDGDRRAILGVLDQGRDAVYSDMRACLQANEQLGGYAVATVFSLEVMQSLIAEDETDRWFDGWQTETAMTGSVPVTFLTGADHCIVRLVWTEDGYELSDIWSAADGRVTIQLRSLDEQSFVLLKKVDVTQAVELNAENFPDANFLAWLQNESGYAVRIDGRYYADPELVTVIHCWYWDIQDLTGIELFPELTSLCCYYNQLTALDASGFVKLQELQCYDCQITELTLGSLPELTYLDCSGNQLTALDVSGCPKLETLYCSYNKLAELDVSGATALEYLYCHDNRLTLLTLDPSLRSLDCGNNRLAVLDLRDQASLQRLNAMGNVLSQLFLPGTENTDLYDVYYDESTSGATLTPDGQGGYLLDLRTLGITAEGLARVTVLSPAVTVTDGVVCFTEKPDRMVYTFDTGRLNQETGSNYLLTVTLILGEDVAIDETNFPDPNFRNYVKEEIAGGRDVLTVAEIAGTTRIDCPNREIRDLTGIQIFTELKELYCYNNPLTSLDLGGNTELTHLSCGSCDLTELDLNGNTKLIYLDCVYNELTELDLGENIALTGLYCYGNRLAWLSVPESENLWVEASSQYLNSWGDPFVVYQPQDGPYTFDLRNVMPEEQLVHVTAGSGDMDFDLETLCFSSDDQGRKYIYYYYEISTAFNTWSMTVELYVKCVPSLDVTKTSFSDLTYDETGWTVWDMDVGVYYPVTPEQVSEILDHNTVELVLEARPADEDAVMALLQDDMSHISEIRFLFGGAYSLEITPEMNFNGIVMVLNADADITILRTDDRKTNITVYTGKLRYTGQVEGLWLFGTEQCPSDPNSQVYITGDVDLVEWVVAPFGNGSKPYEGSVWISGTVEEGRCLGPMVVDLSEYNIGEVIFDMPVRTFTKTTVSGEPVEIIAAGSGLTSAVVTEEAAFDRENLTLEFYGVEDDTDWRVVVYEQTYGMWSRYKTLEGFHADQLPSGQNVTVYINGKINYTGDLLTINGAFREVHIDRSGVRFTGSANRVVIKGEDSSDMTDYDRTVEIDGAVNQLELYYWLRSYSEIRLGAQGSVRTGEWRRYDPASTDYMWMYFYPTVGDTILQRGDMPILLYDREREDGAFGAIVADRTALTGAASISGEGSFVAASVTSGTESLSEEERAQVQTAFGGTSVETPCMTYNIGTYCLHLDQNGYTSYNGAVELYSPVSITLEKPSDAGEYRVVRFMNEEVTALENSSSTANTITVESILPARFLVVRLNGYNVTVNADDCTIIGLHDIESAGETVTFTVTVNTPGYEVNEVTVVAGSNTNVPVSISEGNTYSFTMPASDVTITVTIREKQLYTVSLEDSELHGGTVQIETECSQGDQYSYAGDTVTLTLTPEDGYQVGQVSVRISGSNPGDTLPMTGPDEQGRYTFVMPNYDVMIRVVFIIQDGYYLIGTMNDWSADELIPSMKFAANPNAESEYMLTWVFGAATDEFKVVHLVDGQIAVWYGTKKEGHKGDGNEEQAYNYRINDQTGARTVYFRPVWNDAWSGHIWIGEDVVPHAFLMESSASFNDSIKMNFYVDYSAAAGNMPEGVQAVLTCNGNTVKFPVANTPYVPGKGYKISYDLVAKQVEDVVNIKLVDANDQPFLFTSKKGTRDYTVNGKDLTLREYLDYMLILSDWNALGQAAMDYCYAAKQRFKYGWTEGLYSFSTAVGNVTISDLDQYAPIKIGTMPTGVSTDQITAMFESDNSFRMYLKYNEANTEGNYTYAVDAVTSVDDPTLLKWSDDYQKYYLTFTGVYSNMLQEYHEIKVYNNDCSYTYKACVLTYARSVLKYSSESDMITLVQALYLYNQAAVDKFKEQH